MRHASTTARMMLPVVHGKERQALKYLIKVYGDDVDAVLNGLHAMAARIALASGVEADQFAAGVKHHWDFLAEHVNEISQEEAGSRAPS